MENTTEKFHKKKYIKYQTEAETYEAADRGSKVDTEGRPCEAEARPSQLKTRSSADADNRLDAFSGQSRSTNIVPFHMLHIVSYCAIVTCL